MKTWTSKTVNSLDAYKTTKKGKPENTAVTRMEIAKADESKQRMKCRGSYKPEIMKRENEEAAETENSHQQQKKNSHVVAAGYIAGLKVGECAC